MAYINEKLTILQKEAFEKRKINNPLYLNKVLVPNFWTVDHDRNTYLINVGAYHDVPNEQLFVFIYNLNTYLFTLQMSDVDNGTKRWKLVKYAMLSGSQKFNEEQLLDNFKDALSEYKYNGLPSGYKQQFQMKIEL